MNHRQFNKFVDEIADGLYAFVLKNIRNTDDAKDIVQESFKRLWQNRKKLIDGKAKSYIFKIAFNLVIDYSKANLRQKEIELADFNSYSYELAQSDLGEILNKALDTLKPEYRTLILLRDYEGYSYKEIAEITGFSESQVKVYIFRSRKQLRDYIGKLENVI